MKNFLLAISLFIGLVSFAQNGSIKGTIFMEDTNNVMPAAKVLLTQDNKIHQKVVADLKGNYVFNDVPAGEWVVKASATGYDTTYVVGIIVQPNKQSFLDVTLYDFTEVIIPCCRCYSFIGPTYSLREMAAGVGVRNE